LGKDEDPGNDPLLAAYDGSDNHLVAHSDCEGLYFPIEIQEVVLDPSGEIIEGGYLGSSLRLAEELRAIAPLIGIHLSGGDIPSNLVEEIGATSEAETGFYREREVWLTLYEAVQHSIKSGAAIVFC
jgi:hypothetical protein